MPDLLALLLHFEVVGHQGLIEVTRDDVVAVGRGTDGDDEGL